MVKVLLICSQFMWYAESFQKAFTDSGCEVKCMTSAIGLRQGDYFQRIRNYLGFSMEDLKERRRQEFSQEALGVFEEFGPDLVYVILGDQLTAEAVQAMSASSKTVLKLSDTLNVYPYVKQTVAYYDEVYTYELSDIGLLEQLGATAKASMAAYEPSQYYPLHIPKDIDVCFVGKMYPQRKALLDRLAADLPGINLSFWGVYVKPNHPIEYSSWYFGKKRSVFHNRNIHYTEVNKLYNRSKICLNINGYQTQDGWGSRLPEILGTGSFQLVDHNEAICREFSGCLEMFLSYAEMKEKILYYLEHEQDREIIASAGYQKAVASHTRMVQIRDTVNSAQSG